MVASESPLEITPINWLAGITLTLVFVFLFLARWQRHGNPESQIGWALPAEVRLALSLKQLTQFICSRDTVHWKE